MNWEAIGAVGEILGAIAVLITLGYLAVQIRQSTRAMQTSTLSSLHDVHLLTRDNERYIALLMKSQAKEELTPEERIHMVERFYTIVRGLEGIWLQQQLGAVTRDQFDQRLDLLRWAMSPPEARRMWTQLAPTFAPGFCRVVETKVLSGDAPPSHMNRALAALDPDWIDRD
jgi:hypothetical protein